MKQGIRIDWNCGTWRLWDIQTGGKLAEAEHVVIQGTTEFVNCDNRTHGYAVTCGEIEQTGSRIVIKG